MSRPVDLAALVAGLPFAAVDPAEVVVLTAFARRADDPSVGAERRRTIADLIVARLWQDVAVHEVCDNWIKANVIRDAIDAIDAAAAFSP